MRPPWKMRVTLASTVILLGVEAAVFWQQDWRYSLPAQKPPELRQPPIGAALNLPPEVEGIRKKTPGRPVLLHFYNPGCPCSRFNLDHVRHLARQQRGKAKVIGVLQAVRGDTSDIEREARELGLPVVADPDGSIAAVCGVYSTPQAVVLDGEGRLAFRGNYNVSRYCVAPATEFARLALEAAVRGQRTPELPDAAVVAYGCALPAARME